MAYDNSVGEFLADAVIDVTHNDIVETIQQDLVGSNELFKEIKNKTHKFLKIVEEYDALPKKAGTIGQQLAKLRYKKDFIYAQFFEIQNLINAYLGQKIIMAYVHIDDFGRREVRIANNDIEHLGISRGEFRGNPFYKLGYDVQEKFQRLKTGLDYEDENALQETAQEVENRYNKYNHNVLWQWNNQWKGWYFPTRGPINEAFVNMYVHQVQLRNSLEGNIDTFILDENYGAIQADATKGFLIGDVSKDGVQYAVKGVYGSPQGFKLIVKELKKLVEHDFSKEAFNAFIKKYTEDELFKEVDGVQTKRYKPQIKKLSQQTMDNLLAEMQKALTK